MAPEQPPLQRLCVPSMRIHGHLFMKLNSPSQEMMLLPLTKTRQTDGLRVSIQETGGARFEAFPDITHLIVKSDLADEASAEDLWISKQDMSRIYDMLARAFGSKASHKLLMYPGERPDDGASYYLDLGTSEDGGRFVVPMTGGFTVSPPTAGNTVSTLAPGAVIIDVHCIEFKAAAAAAKVVKELPGALCNGLNLWVFNNILKNAMNITLGQG